MNVSDVDRAVREWCESQGLRWIEIAPQGRGKSCRGFPTRAALGPGRRIVYVFLKAPGAGLSHHEAKWRRELRGLGFSASPADNFETAVSAILEIFS